jgi:hypothetical protein
MRFIVIPLVVGLLVAPRWGKIDLEESKQDAITALLVASTTSFALWLTG